MVWPKIEKIVGEVIPTCVKKIMSSCGFDTIASLRNISLESILRIEEHINERMNNGSIDVIQPIECCHHEFYKKQRNFTFLPGHKEFLLALPKYIDHDNTCDNINESNGHANAYESLEKK